MVTGESIEGYHCEACSKTVTLSKKVALKSLPNTLIVHLNRIVFDMDTLRNVKVNDRFEFPSVLNLRQYMLDEVVAKSKDTLKKKQQAEAESRPAEAENEEPSGKQGTAEDEERRREDAKEEEQADENAQMIDTGAD